MKTIIIDDELLNIKNLEIILQENFPQICVQASFQNVQSAFEYINYMNEKFPLALQELKNISE